MRDLDFGRRFVDYAAALDWPDDVVVEDLSSAPHLVLHRLQELMPATVVLVGSVERGTGGPGSVRRYRLDPAAPRPADVHFSLSEGLAGASDLGHTLTVLRHWGALPADTTVVEVEPADTSFGLGFSEEVGAAIQQIVDLVRAEVASSGDDLVGDDLFPARDRLSRSGAIESRARVTDLADYASLQGHASDATAGVRHGMLPDAPHVAGLAMAVRSRPFGTGLHTKGDWYDFVPLADGWLGIAMGDVVERGLEAALVMSHLRSATRVAARARGPAPGAVLAAVDRVVAEIGLGQASTLLYLAVHAESGEVRLANAGHCRPLLVAEQGSAASFPEASSPRLGVGPRGPEARPEAAVRLTPSWSLLLYTDGLLVHEGARDDPLQRLVRAATTGPREVDDLCDHVMSCCLGGVRRRDDASLLVLRPTGETGTS
jgi:hydrogenase maturation protease